MTDITRGLMLMGYGLIGVFGTLILFYVCAKVLMRVGGKKSPQP